MPTTKLVRVRLRRRGGGKPPLDPGIVGHPGVKPDHHRYGGLDRVTGGPAACGSGRWVSTPLAGFGNALYHRSCYNATVRTTSAKVSHRGQTSLPADLRHRWGIDEGGVISFIDLGDAALIVPGGVRVARRELHRVLRERYAEGVAAIEDPDLADQ